MDAIFEFKCIKCGEVHKGKPTFGADAPASYYDIPEAERNDRCSIGTDDCTIEGKCFFARGCLEIPVKGAQDPFVWGVWVSLSKASFTEWLAHFGKGERSHVGPFFGWLDTTIMPYPQTRNLKTRVHLRDNGVRPYIELEPTDHPLAIEQHRGITIDRVAEIYSIITHE